MNYRAGDAAQEAECGPNVYKALGWIPSTVQNTTEQQRKNLTIPSPHLAHFPCGIQLFALLCALVAKLMEGILDSEACVG